jgi:hypothetical protein
MNINKAREKKTIIAISTDQTNRGSKDQVSSRSFFLQNYRPNHSSVATNCLNRTNVMFFHLNKLKGHYTSFWVVHCTFNISPPMNITNLFGNWLNRIDKKTKERIRVQVCPLVWTIRNCWNEIVFNRCDNPNFLQVIHKAASLIHLWSYLLSV